MAGKKIVNKQQAVIGTQVVRSRNLQNVQTYERLNSSDMNVTMTTMQKVVNMNREYWNAFSDELKQKTQVDNLVYPTC